MGLHDYYSRGYLDCSPERDKIAELLGLSLVSVSNDIQALQRRGVIESLRTERQHIFVPGRCVEDDGAYYEHFYLDRLYIRSKENLISDLRAGRDKGNFTSDGNLSRLSDVKKALPINREENRELPIESSRSRRAAALKRDRATVVDYVEDLAREFNDEATLAASTSRTMHLYERTGLSLEEFVEARKAARAATKEHSAAIHKQSGRASAAFGPTKNRMAYFFSVLEAELGLAERTEGKR